MSIGRYKQDLAAAQAALARANAENAELARKLAASDAKLQLSVSAGEVGREIQARPTLAVSSDAAVRDVTAQLAAARRDTAIAQNERDGLRRQLAQAADALEQVRGEGIAEARAAAREVSEISDRCAKEVAHRREIEGKLDRAIADLAKEQADAKRARAQEDAAQKRAAKHKARADDTKKRLSQANADVTSLQAEVAKLTARLDAHEARARAMGIFENPNSEAD